jgi:hypothetical protein
LTIFFSPTLRADPGKIKKMSRASPVSFVPACLPVGRREGFTSDPRLTFPSELCPSDVNLQWMQGFSVRIGHLSSVEEGTFWLREKLAGLRSDPDPSRGKERSTPKIKKLVPASPGSLTSPHPRSNTL